MFYVDHQLPSFTLMHIKHETKAVPQTTDGEWWYHQLTIEFS